MGVDGRDFIATKDVGFDRTIVYNNGVNIPYDSTFKIAPSGKVLMCIEGGSAGRKIAITDRDVCFGNKLACFDTIIISDLYLFNILQSNEFLSIFKSSLSGIIGGVSINTLKNFIIPLPPIEEEIRIVNKIKIFEPFLLQYEAAETKLFQLETEFPEKLKKSILQYAIEGKLVKQDPNDEPASVLLERIKAEKEKLIKEGKIKRDKTESYIYQGDDKNYYENLPFGWVKCYLTNVAKIIMGQSPASNTYGHNGMEFHQGKLFFTNMIIGKSNVKTTLPIIIASRCSIVMSVRAPVGEVNYCNREICIGRGLCSIEYLIPELIDYLYIVLKASKKFLNEKSTGTTFKAINMDTIMSLPIVLPPFNEQKRIIAKINQINKYL